ncbi:MAG: tRNA (guanosine(37)-N1)-methyltransferase TrmD [Chitinivibrionia bacterium]|nr:tRNA (guanosine(37)-N1)-methyltransferase TrmD [Chitinivibrionia bacterium]
MNINVISIFPGAMETILSMGTMGIAAKKSLAGYRVVDLRDFAKDNYGSVDDVPYGGGGGMVMMVEPICDAVRSLGLREGSPVILMSPAGRMFDQALAHRFAAADELTFVCGRYKGVDERVRELVATDEVSIGNFVLSGGELAAAVCIEAVVRLLDNVLGNEESRDTDSFSERRKHILDCAYYTRPVEFNGLRVPDVLLSGNHKEIQKWRENSSLERTRARRPDLLANGARES